LVSPLISSCVLVQPSGSYRDLHSFPTRRSSDLPLSGGMEHQTMTTQGYFEKGLTTHELGHQWWGDNVTCESWADIWVNEGFASYSEYLMLENLYPNETTSHMLDIHNNVKSNPNGSVWVQDSLNESRIFSGRLTYDKGAAIVHTFRFIMN